MYSNLEHKYRYSILRREILIIMVSRVLTFEHHYMRGSRIFFKGRGPRDNLFSRGGGSEAYIFGNLQCCNFPGGRGSENGPPLDPRMQYMYKHTKNKEITLDMLRVCRNRFNMGFHLSSQYLLT